jgi:hypothetical protein
MRLSKETPQQEQRQRVFLAFFQIFGNAFRVQQRYRQRFGVQTGKTLP